MKTYTAEEFEVEFYRAMHEWAKGGKVGVDPRENWQKHVYGRWLSDDEAPCFSFGEYRWKPAPKRTVIIDGVELVAPETDAPKGKYFFILVALVESKNWGGYEYEKRWLKEGLIFLTAEDAKAMYEAQRKQRLGGAA
jgi:hypothetical protein